MSTTIGETTPAAPEAPCAIDFNRSFVKFSTTRVNHTPRLQLDAVCSVIEPSGAARSYYLSCTCIGEAMYVPHDLIHEPVCEFNLVMAPRAQAMVLKRFADGRNDVRQPLLFGDTMATHDGKGAKIVELDAHTAQYGAVTPIMTYQEFRDALLDHRPMNGRTTYWDHDGQTRVVMEYPARTINVAHERDAWQVDAGPLLMPLPDASLTGGEEAPEVSRFERAYMVFNSWKYAEAVLMRPTPLADGVATTHHFSLRRRLRCRNELFAAA